MKEHEVKPEDIVSELKKENKISGKDSDFGFYRILQTNKQKTETLEEKENSNIITMRKWWGYSVLGFIAVIIIFDIVLILLYGSEVLSFEDSNIVIAVVVDSFLKIVGLGYLITRNTFEKIYRPQ